VVEEAEGAAAAVTGPNRRHPGVRQLAEGKPVVVEEEAVEVVRPAAAVEVEVVVVEEEEAEAAGLRGAAVAGVADPSCCVLP
jgi:hypothetical protein